MVERGQSLTRAAIEIEASVAKGAADQLEAGEADFGKVRELGAAVMSVHCPSPEPGSPLERVHLATGELMLSQRAHVSSALQASLWTLHALERSAAEVAPPGRQRELGLALLGGLVSLLATLTIAALLLGPSTRYLVFPLVADAVGQIAGIVELTPGLTPVSQGSGIALLMTADAMLMLGALLSLGMAASVVFGPDVAVICLGEPDRALTKAARWLVKLGFASAFALVRIPDLAHVRMPVVAGSAFELAIMLASACVAAHVGRQRRQGRSNREAREALHNKVHALSLHQTRLIQRLGEIDTELRQLAQTQRRPTFDWLRSPIEQYGEIIAELTLLRTVARNNRELIEARARAGADVDPSEPPAASVTVH